MNYTQLKFQGPAHPKFRCHIHARACFPYDAHKGCMVIKEQKSYKIYTFDEKINFLGLKYR